MFRRFLPAAFRLFIRLALRQMKDIITGNRARFAKKTRTYLDLKDNLSLTQPIKKSNYFDNKIANIELGGDRIYDFVIYPNQLFSFWRAVGNPNEKNGYKLGRNIVSGVLAEGYGGGLCQLASCLYHLSLLAGLEIVERHHHSVDIYEESERFTPLGADATVVFGYKDLRIKNNLKSPIRFVFSVINVTGEEDSLRGEIHSLQPIPKKNITFVRIKKNGTETVITKSEERQVAVSVYKA